MGLDARTGSVAAGETRPHRNVPRSRRPSDCATFETAAPWPGPGGVSWAAAETQAPWLSGWSVDASGLAAAVVVVVGASVVLVVVSSTEVLVVASSVVDVVVSSPVRTV